MQTTVTDGQGHVIDPPHYTPEEKQAAALERIAIAVEQLVVLLTIPEEDDAVS